MRARRVSSKLPGSNRKNLELPTSNCEDYRAGASIDMEHDEEDLKRKILCPVLALWGGRGAVHRLFDTLAVWRERAANVSGKPLPGRHFLPEEIPDETLAALRTFLNT